MKNYEAVVRGRYNRQKYDSSSIRNNKYAPINPTGFYGEFKANQVLFEFINMLYYRKKIYIRLESATVDAGMETRQDLWQSCYRSLIMCLVQNTQKFDWNIVKE